jgi:predicted GIY-YIG superfamily endonuclease
VSEQPDPGPPTTTDQGEHESHTLYRFFGSDGALLYIGITSNVRNRWSRHSKHRLDWQLIASATMEHYPSRAEVLEAEKAAIRSERPLWNKVHNRRSLAEVWALHAAGGWLTADDLAVLFNVKKKVARTWVERRGPFGTGALPHRLSADEELEVCPKAVERMMTERRKIRSGLFPGGIPGRFEDLAEWAAARDLADLSAS